MQTWATRLGGTLAALTWVVGLPVIGLAGVIPSDEQYYVAGVVLAFLGCAIVLFAMTLRALGPNRRPGRALKVAGAAIGGLMAATSALLALGAAGAFGDAPPGWIPTAAVAPVFALFAWALLLSAAARRELGGAALWAAVIASASVLAAIVTSVVIPVATNATVPIFFATTLAMWAGLPAWLLTVSWRRAPNLSS